MTLRLAVPVSGTGSLLAAMIEQDIPIKLVVADRQCRALEIAATARIPCRLLSRSFGEDFDREKYTGAMLDIFHDHNIGLVAMAGFRTSFAPSMFASTAYQLKILNSHPSLLPAFKGHHPVRDAIKYGVRVSGFTIHWAVPELDAGPIIAQHPVQVLPGDTTESLHERIKVVERELYPAIIKEFIE